MLWLLWDVVIVELYHVYSNLWGCGLTCEVVLIFMSEEPKWSFDEWTEILMLLNELNLVEFLFSCLGYVSRIVWEKTRFFCEKLKFKRFSK